MTVPRFSIAVRQSNTVSILDLQGFMGIGEAVQSFRDKMFELLNAGTKNIAINLSGVKYLDSSAIGALVGAFTTIETAGGKCRMFAASEEALRALRIAHLEDALGLVADEATAVAAFTA